MYFWLNPLGQVRSIFSKYLLIVLRYSEALASTRILKHSPESSSGKCGENLAWASYNQSGKINFCSYIRKACIKPFSVKNQILLYSVICST